MGQKISKKAKSKEPIPSSISAQTKLSLAAKLWYFAPLVLALENFWDFEYSYKYDEKLEQIIAATHGVLEKLEFKELGSGGPDYFRTFEMECSVYNKETECKIEVVASGIGNEMIGRRASAFSMIRKLVGMYGQDTFGELLPISQWHKLEARTTTIHQLYWKKN